MKCSVVFVFAMPLITDYPGVGSFGYKRADKPYAVTSVTPYGTAIPLREQTINYNGMQRPTMIAENGYVATLAYNPDGDRVKMQITQNGGDYLTRYYIGGQYETEAGVAGTKEKLYLSGDAYSAAAVLVKENGGAWNIYYLGRDYQGSITHLINSSGTVVQELSYDPWGRLRNPANQELYAVGAEPTPFLGRGYTGHEHLTMFGLINMNARLYDPAVGRFLSPDPYVQSPDFSQNFNRYSYCLNNPLKFTDQNGEFIHLIIGAIVGGVINWAANGCKFSWEGLSYFGAGAVAGVATALSPGSFIAISAGLSGANSIIGQGFNNGWKNIDFGQVAGSAIMGGVTSYAGGLMGSAMHLDKLLNGISSPLLQKGLQGVIGGAVIGSTFGGMSAVANGHNFFDGAWSGAKMGLVTGAISGLGSAVQYSTKNHVNLLTGKAIVNQSVNSPAVRTEPQNLAEQLSLKAAKNGGGIEIMKGQINDPARQNWQKMQYTHQQPDGSHIVIHYWRNPTTGETNGFKFK